MLMDLSFPCGISSNNSHSATMFHECFICTGCRLETPHPRRCHGKKTIEGCYPQENAFLRITLAFRPAACSLLFNADGSTKYGTAKYPSCLVLIVLDLPCGN